ncbi:lipopolysaccharide biosynthesis protein [Radicibacter daui]|uniref:lipopolysaccharide biosynthesis protein n=1 Tax=Radicibacter daui TaxID=3064829 RepID=UPI0040469312
MSRGTTGRGSVLRHALGGFAVRGLEVGCKFLLYMLAAHLLGKAESGFLFLAMTWGHLAATCSRLGVEKALTRLVAAELAIGQGLKARHLAIRGALVVLAAGLVLGGATMVAAPLAADLLFHDAAAGPALRMSGLVIPGMALAFTITGIMTGLGRTVSAQLLQNVFWPAGLLAGLLMGQREAEGLIATLAVTMLLTVACGLAALLADRRSLAADEPLPPDAGLLPGMRATAAPLYVVELVQVSIASLPVLILGMFADAGAVSIFSVASRASMLVLVVLISLGTMAAPRYAGLHRKRLTDDLKALNHRIQLAGAVIGGGLSLILAVAAFPLLSLLGQGFADGSLVLVVMASGQMVNALYSGQDVLLAMTGHGPALRLLNIVQFSVISLLGLVLIPVFGAMGAAIATAVCTAQGGIGTAAVARLLVPEAAPFLAPSMPLKLRSYFTG